MQKLKEYAPRQARAALILYCNEVAKALVTLNCPRPSPQQGTWGPSSGVLEDQGDQEVQERRGRRTEAAEPPRRILQPRLRPESQMKTPDYCLPALCSL